MIDGSIGGVPARELAAAYGTPLAVIDTGELDLEIDRFVRAFVVARHRGRLRRQSVSRHRARGTARRDAAAARRVFARRTDHRRARRLSGRTHLLSRRRENRRGAARRSPNGRVAFGVIDNARRDRTAGRDRARRRAGRRDAAHQHRHRSAHARVHSHRRRKHEVRHPRTRRARHASSASPALPQLRLIGLHSHVGSQIVDVEPLVANLASADRRTRTPRARSDHRSTS